MGKLNVTLVSKLYPLDILDYGVRITPPIIPEGGVLVYTPKIIIGVKNFYIKDYLKILSPSIREGYFEWCPRSINGFSDTKITSPRILHGYFIFRSTYTDNYSVSCGNILDGRVSSKLEFIIQSPEDVITYIPEIKPGYITPRLRIQDNCQVNLGTVLDGYLYTLHFFDKYTTFFPNILNGYSLTKYPALDSCQILSPEISDSGLLTYLILLIIVDHEDILTYNPEILSGSMKCLHQVLNRSDDFSAAFDCKINGIKSIEFLRETLTLHLEVEHEDIITYNPGILDGLLKCIRQTLYRTDDFNALIECKINGINSLVFLRVLTTFNYNDKLNINTNIFKISFISGDIVLDRKFVAFPSSGTTSATSPDGITWTQRTLPYFANWYGIIWNGTLFCAVACNSAVALTSPDGITWTIRGLPVNTWWAYVAWNGTVFCAITYSDFYVAATSPDGITWTQRTLLGVGYYNAITSNGIIFCAVGNNIVATSPDGITWTQRTLPINATWISIIWNGTVFCATRNGNSVVTSPDGITWTQRTLPVNANWCSIAWNGTVFCVVAYDSNIAATSPDGITWTQRTLPANTGWRSIAWNGTVFCVVTSSNIAATSPDGITWTQRTLPINGNIITSNILNTDIYSVLKPSDKLNINTYVDLINFEHFDSYLRYEEKLNIHASIDRIYHDLYLNYDFLSNIDHMFLNSLNIINLLYSDFPVKDKEYTINLVDWV